MVLWGSIVIYAAIAASLFCTIGVYVYRYCAAPHTNKLWVRACAILGFALGAFLWPLTLVAGFVWYGLSVGDSISESRKWAEGGSPC